MCPADDEFGSGRMGLCCAERSEDDIPTVAEAVRMNSTGASEDEPNPAVSLLVVLVTCRRHVGTTCSQRDRSITACSAL